MPGGGVLPAMVWPGMVPRRTLSATLMTRGMKGCYLYCTDMETREYFSRRATAIRSFADF